MGLGEYLHLQVWQGSCRTFEGMLSDTKVQAQGQCPAQILKCGIFLLYSVPGAAGNVGRLVRHCSIQSSGELLQKVLHLTTQIVLLLTDPEYFTQKKSSVLVFLEGQPGTPAVLLPALLPPIQSLPGEWTVCGWEKFRTMIRHVLSSSVLHVPYNLSII